MKLISIIKNIVNEASVDHKVLKKRDGVEDKDSKKETKKVKDLYKNLKQKYPNYEDRLKAAKQYSDKPKEFLKDLEKKSKEK